MSVFFFFCKCIVDGCIFEEKKNGEDFSKCLQLDLKALYKNFEDLHDYPFNGQFFFTFFFLRFRYKFLIVQGKVENFELSGNILNIIHWGEI